MSSVNKNRIALACIAALFGLLSFQGLAPVQAQGDEDNQSRLNPPQAQYTTEGVEGCLACHLTDRMSATAETAHGNVDNPHSPYATKSCESCHGPGSFHSSRARGGFGFPPLTTFQWGRETRQEQMQACMGCHQQDMGNLQRIGWYGSLHEDIGMTCNYCHQLHVVDDGLKEKQSQQEQCSRCHSRHLETHMGGEELFNRAKCSACHKVHELLPKHQ